jgi:triacylglycerol esterase/lipase EstA (alpha/beta hydrolase family)
MSLRSSAASFLAATAATVALAAAVALAAPVAARAQYHVPYGSEALSDAVFNETWAPQYVEGANNGCTPSSAHPYPVVLVHATLADEGSNWVTLAPLLANNGYCVYAFNYGPTGLSFCDAAGCRIDALGHIERSAEELAAFVNWVLFVTSAAKVDLVGHSQGGMMPNYYIKYLNGASKVNELVGLSPSNHGTTLDGLTALLEQFPFAKELTSSLAEYIGAPALPEQEQGSAFINKLFGSGEPLAAGVRYVVIQTTHDEVVTPYTNAFLSGANVTNITIQSQCPADPVAHIGMFDDSPSLQNVLNQLSSSPNASFEAICTNFGQGI